MSTFSQVRTIEHKYSMCNDFQYSLTNSLVNLHINIFYWLVFHIHYSVDKISKMKWERILILIKWLSWRGPAQWFFLLLIIIMVIMIQSSDQVSACLINYDKVWICTYAYIFKNLFFMILAFTFSLTADTKAPTCISV